MIAGLLTFGPFAHARTLLDPLPGYLLGLCDMVALSIGIHVLCRLNGISNRERRGQRTGGGLFGSG